MSWVQSQIHVQARLCTACRHSRPPCCQPQGFWISNLAAWTDTNCHASLVSHNFVTPTVKLVPHGRRLRLVFARPEPWTEGPPACAGLLPQRRPPLPRHGSGAFGVQGALGQPEGFQVGRQLGKATTGQAGDQALQDVLRKVGCHLSQHGFPGGPPSCRGWPEVRPAPPTAGPAPGSPCLSGNPAHPARQAGRLVSRHGRCQPAGAAVGPGGGGCRGGRR